MSSTDLEVVAESVLRLAEPGMRPRQLVEAVRKEHPKARKKEIVRAAFYALISNAVRDVERVARLHSFALSERLGQDE